MTKIQDLPSFRGYSCIPHFTLLAVKDKRISFALLGAYIAFVSLANFDVSSKYYGCINRTNKDIAKALSIDHTSIKKQVDKLIAAKLIIYREVNGVPLIALAFPQIHRYQTASKLTRMTFFNWDNVVSELPGLIEDFPPVEESNHKYFEKILTHTSDIPTPNINTPYKEISIPIPSNNEVCAICSKSVNKGDRWCGSCMDEMASTVPLQR